MDMFMALIVVMISWMRTYVQTQVANIQYVQLFACQSQIKKKNLQRKTTPPQIFSKGTDWTTFNSAFHYHLYCLQIVSHFNLILIIHIPPQKYIWRFSLDWEDWILLDKLPTVFLYDHNFMTAVKRSILIFLSHSLPSFQILFLPLS